ncbi:MAG: hypothetical protein JSU95_14630 [Betaproteobacteria bacterium]|nr:MAG: hypothetical protein JSU95_14630 [Betaproteobacteria bacterium]
MYTSQERYHYKLLATASLALIACIAVTGCQTVADRLVTPISTIVEAAQSGASSEVIIAQFRAGNTTYALRGSDFANLAARGVPGPVLDELQQDFFSDVETLSQRWFTRRASGGPDSIFPQPLDLDTLDSGGNGMAPASNLGRQTHGSRPPGVPEWVPPFPASSGQFIGPNDLLEMTASGMSTSEIVDSVMNSRIRPLYTPSGGTSRARIGAITGSMFASLVEQGVPPEAVDALQAINIADHVEATRIRFQRSLF